MMKDTVIKIESSCRYLGHMITYNFDDNEDVMRELRSFIVKQIWYCTAYIQLPFSQCYLLLR